MAFVEAVQNWVTVIAASVSMVAVATGIWLSLREYRIKLRSERRQQDTADIEAEVRLQTHFTELMQIANARSGYVHSESAVQFMLDNLPDKQMPPKALNQLLEDVSILAYPVGSASQDAAIAAISTLTLKYDVLREPGLRALRSLCEPFTSIQAKRYLEQTCSSLGIATWDEGDSRNALVVREKHAFINGSSKVLPIRVEDSSDAHLLEPGRTFSIETELSVAKPLNVMLSDEGVHIYRDSQSSV